VFGPDVNQSRDRETQCRLSAVLYRFLVSCCARSWKSSAHSLEKQLAPIDLALRLRSPESVPLLRCVWCRHALTRLSTRESPKLLLYGNLVRGLVAEIELISTRHTGWLLGYEARIHKTR